MRSLLITLANIVLALSFTLQASAWIYVPNKGDTGWQTYAYIAGPAGFSGTAGFVVSNVIDPYGYSELLLDNLVGGGVTNPGFETGNLTGFTRVVSGTQSSAAQVSTSETALSGTTYNPTQPIYLAVLQGLANGVPTSQFQNATGQTGTVGSILETSINLGAGEQFSFNWAFLGQDSSPWNDFALFYLKGPNGIVFSNGLAQIGSAPAVPVPPSVLLLGSGLLGLLGWAWKEKRPG